MSARTSPRAWDLRCEVREKLLAFLQAEYPRALPRRRAELVETQGPAGDDGRGDTIRKTDKRGKAGNRPTSLDQGSVAVASG
ncbi:hypothetical protein [Chelatococcus asaccharovorans]|uniref:Uncharacterized protein n=1 Tax=Chelatococcus asaccharovorans TaxID=28210 RepID=A0A2V3U1R8_9HYPH|nr:hypothetical protein C7450_109198 [Chelatococcus asaccharovorans]